MKDTLLTTNGLKRMRNCSVAPILSGFQRFLTVVTADEQAVNCACTLEQTFKINSNVRASNCIYPKRVPKKFTHKLNSSVSHSIRKSKGK